MIRNPGHSEGISVPIGRGTAYEQLIRRLERLAWRVRKPAYLVTTFLMLSQFMPGSSSVAVAG
jgi:hypothetical protein